MFSGGVDNQYRTVMGWKKFQRNSLLVRISKYGRELKNISEKRDSPFPKNYP